jgi:hypothetical protein
VLTTIEMTTIEKGKIDQPCWIVCGDGLRMRCIWWRGEMSRKKRTTKSFIIQFCSCENSNKNGGS